MLALAAAPLDVACTVLDPAPDACARVAAEHIEAAFDDAAALARLADAVDVVTFEFENVPAAGLATVAGRAQTAPNAHALETSQDRLAEKRLFERLGISTAPYRAVDSPDALRAAVAELGTPAILKTRRLGYDGKGQARIASPADAESAWRAVATAPSILEAQVDFERELSIVAVRGSNGDTVFYPLSENVHHEGILRESRAPAPGLDANAVHAARRFAAKLMDALEYVGVLTLELFEHDGELLANEFAPRVHNSGHWTIDAAPCSQFENHLRAIFGMPLGATEPVVECTMLNLIGNLPAREELLAVPGAHVHLYGKEPRPGRKLGHVTLISAQAGEGGDEAAHRLRAAVQAAAR